MITGQQVVPHIKNGTVIDHIPAGAVLRLMEALQLDQSNHLITLGLNVESPSMGKKDLLKLEEIFLDSDDIEKIAIFAPKAVVNQIEKGNVVNKTPVKRPKLIKGFFQCPNSSCISNHEKTSRIFFVEEHPGSHRLRCKHCETLFDHQEVSL